LSILPPFVLFWRLFFGKEKAKASLARKERLKKQSPQQTDF